jgi:hypothetical protein
MRFASSFQRGKLKHRINRGRSLDAARREGGETMRSGFLHLLVVIALPVSLLANGQDSKPKSQPENGGDFSNVTSAVTKVPTGVILIKGAWSSASDPVTPVPEGGSVSNHVFQNEYFGMHYALPSGWTQRYEGPPPSDSGRYVLAQIRPADRNAKIKGNILITAQDMFFTPMPAGNVLQYMNYVKDHLQEDYKLEQPITQTKIAGRSFDFLAYWSPVAQLHWYVLAMQSRCHTVEIVLSSQDTKLLGSLVLDLDKMTLPAEAGLTAGLGGGDAPVCIKGFASGDHVMARVDPIFSEAKFNPVPVRIIIDRKGNVKHIHFLSAFPDQAKAITDALKQWKFKPYVRDGVAAEVETGLMFGRAPRTIATQSSATE